MFLHLITSDVFFGEEFNKWVTEMKKKKASFTPYMFLEIKVTKLQIKYNGNQALWNPWFYLFNFGEWDSPVHNHSSVCTVLQKFDTIYQAWIRETVAWLWESTYVPLSRRVLLLTSNPYFPTQKYIRLFLAYSFVPQEGNLGEKASEGDHDAFRTGIMWSTWVIIMLECALGLS